MHVGGGALRGAPEGAAKRRIGGCAPGDGAAVPEAAAKKRRVGDAGAPDTDVARVALEASEGEYRAQTATCLDGVGQGRGGRYAACLRRPRSWAACRRG